MSSFPVEYRYVHLIIFILFVISFIPVYHIYVRAICNRSDTNKPRHRHRKATIDSSNSSAPSSPPSSPSSTTIKVATTTKTDQQKKAIHLPLKLRLCLFLSTTLALIYMILNTIQVIYYFINAQHNYSPIFFCKFKGAIQVFAYIWSKGILYCFFVFRAQHIFKGTDMQYTKCTIYGLLTMVLIICTTATIPSIYVRWTQFDHYITTDITNQGIICTNRRIEGHNVQLIWFGFMCVLLAQIGDWIIAYICVHLTVSRLFRLVREQSQEMDNTRSNSMLLLISRLFILLCVAVCSSQLALILGIINIEYLIIWYGIDSCINMYCLWLNFKFGSYYYYKYFCGKSCIKYCFPCMKTLALTCTSCGDRDQSCYKQCCNCCCYCCMYCCCGGKNREQQLELYIKSKVETEKMTFE